MASSMALGVSWDAAIAIRHSVEEALGLSGKVRMLLRSDNVALENDVNKDDFRSVPAVHGA